MQGMTELTERRRVEDQDNWFLGVQDEIRRGALTDERTISCTGGRRTCQGRGRGAGGERRRGGIIIGLRFIPRACLGGGCEAPRVFAGISWYASRGSWEASWRQR